MVVVDRLAKYVHFMPLSHPYIAVKVAAVLMKEIFRLHGMPQSIVNDRDVVFTSKFWQELFRLQGKTSRQQLDHVFNLPSSDRWLD